MRVRPLYFSAMTRKNVKPALEIFHQEEAHTMSNNPKVSGLRNSRDNWFTCVDTAVITDKYLSLSAKNVFFALCVIAGFGYRSCSPSDEEVAEITCESLQRLHVFYEELEDRGVIVRDGEVIHIIGHNAPCYREEEE